MSAYTTILQYIALYLLHLRHCERLCDVCNTLIYYFLFIYQGKINYIVLPLTSIKQYLARRNLKYEYNLFENDM